MSLCRFLGAMMESDIGRLTQFIVNEKGVTFVPSFLIMYEEEIRGDILAATVMAVADVQITE